MLEKWGTKCMAHELLRRRHETLGELLNKIDASLAHSQTFGTDMKSDVVEKDDCFEVTADIPGADKSDVKVDYEADTLHIAATRHEIKDHSDKDGNILQSERSFGSVGRRPRLQKRRVSKLKIKQK